jgi:hypothetical protein
MCFAVKSIFSTKYAAVIAEFFLALLRGCSDDNNKEVSSYSSSVFISSSSSVFSSSVSSSSTPSSSSLSSSLTNSPEAGQWYAPAYGCDLSVSVGLV